MYAEYEMLKGVEQRKNKLIEVISISKSLDISQLTMNRSFCEDTISSVKLMSENNSIMRGSLNSIEMCNSVSSDFRKNCEDTKMIS